MGIAHPLSPTIQAPLVHDHEIVKAGRYAQGKLSMIYYISKTTLFRLDIVHGWGAKLEGRSRGCAMMTHVRAACQRRASSLKPKLTYSSVIIDLALQLNGMAVPSATRSTKLIVLSRRAKARQSRTSPCQVCASVGVAPRTRASTLGYCKLVDTLCACRASPQTPLRCRLPQ